jgi:hypothetical protein
MMRRATASLVLAALAASAGEASAARPATSGETAALQRSARFWITVGDPSLGALFHVTRACMSTEEPGFAAAIVVNPRTEPQRMVVLFHRLPHLRTGWNPYASGSPRNVWPDVPGDPAKTRAQRDLHAHCALLAWAR